MKTKPAAVTFSVGQAVRWPYAPMQIAQVAELRRTCVRLVYRTRAGTRKRGGAKPGQLRQPIVDAFTLDLLQDPADPLLPLSNLMGRGIVKARAKTFGIDAGAKDRAGK